MTRQGGQPDEPSPPIAISVSSQRLTELYAPLRYIPDLPASLVGPSRPLGYTPRQPKAGSRNFHNWLLLSSRLTPISAIPVLADALERGYASCGVYIYKEVAAAEAGLTERERTNWHDATTIRVMDSCLQYPLDLMLEVLRRCRDCPQPSFYADSACLEPDWIWLPVATNKSDDADAPILRAQQPFMLSVFRPALKLPRLSVRRKYRHLYTALRNVFEVRLFSQLDWISHLKYLHQQLVLLVGEVSRAPTRRASEHDNLRLKCYELWLSNRGLTIMQLREELLENFQGIGEPCLSTVGDWRQQFELGVVPPADLGDAT